MPPKKADKSSEKPAKKLNEDEGEAVLLEVRSYIASIIRSDRPPKRDHAHTAYHPWQRFALPATDSDSDISSDST